MPGPGAVLGTALLTLTLLASPHAGHVRVRATTCPPGRTIRVAGQRSTLCAEVKITPHADHRLVKVVWMYSERVGAAASASGPEFPEGLSDPFAPAGEMFEEERMDGNVGSTEDDLDGAAEPVTIRPTGYKMEDLSGGTYDIRVVVLDGSGKVTCSGVTTVKIL